MSAPADENADVTFTGEIAEDVEKWASSEFASYFTRRPRNECLESKQINDPVAGVIDVEPLEQYVLDSPLLQRLRYVRQLGVGHVLFPTSAYSRFEHSLGAMHAAGQMFDAIVQTPQPNGQTIFCGREVAWRRSIVRLAALLHDAGHCVFSHVSEKFYRHYGPLQSAQKFFSLRYGNRVSASETLTILLLQTAAFRQLLARGDAERLTGKKIGEVVRMVCACVAGSKTVVAPDAFLAEIVNGPVDCDKLDYLARDAHFAGVPIALDTRRLLSKLRLSTVVRSSVPMHALTIVQSGTRALDELAVTRVFLYDKFYYHPKLMAAEEVIRSALRALERAQPSIANPVSLLSLGDDELLHLRAVDFAARFAVAASDPHINRAVDLFGRIRTRHLPKRAFAFADRFLPQRNPTVAAFEGTAEDSATEMAVDMSQLSRDLEDSAYLDKFSDSIREKSALLDAPGEVFVAHQNARRAGGSMHLDVLLPNGSVERASDLKFKSSEWTEAYALNKATSYVYAYEDLTKVHLAAELVLAEPPHRLRGFGPSSWMAAKVDIREIEVVRQSLPAAWGAVRVRSDFLTTKEAQERIAALRSKFSSFLTAFLHTDIADEIIEAWVSQFETADLQESAIRLLEHVRFIEPHETLQAVQNLVGKQPELRAALWVPLSPSRHGKSAEQVMIDYRRAGLRFKMLGELTVAEIQEAKSVVFFDDALFTGTQSGAMVRGLLGAPAEPRDPISDRPEALPAEIIDALKTTDVSFVYYAAHPTGRLELQETAAATGLGKGTVRIYAELDASVSELGLAGLVCATDEAKNRLLEFMSEMGTSLLEERAEEKQWPMGQARAFALGFGGISSTLVFRHSIATATPVVLWETAHERWLPLFPRDASKVAAALQGRASFRMLPEFHDSRDVLLGA